MGWVWGGGTVLRNKTFFERVAKLIVSVRVQMYSCVCARMKIWWRLQFLLLFLLAISHQFISPALAHNRFMQQFSQQSFTPVVSCAYSLSHFLFFLTLPSFHPILPLSNIHSLVIIIKQPSVVIHTNFHIALTLTSVSLSLAFHENSLTNEENFSRSLTEISI